MVSLVVFVRPMLIANLQQARLLAPNARCLRIFNMQAPWANLQMINPSHHAQALGRQTHVALNYSGVRRSHHFPVYILVFCLAFLCPAVRHGFGAL